MLNLYRNIEEFYNIIGGEGRLISIDFGQKKIGLAISSDNRSFALPLALIKNDNATFSTIMSYILQNKIVGAVIGLPVNMDGTMGPSANLAQNFAKKLYDHIQIPVFLQDERRTSKAADSLLAFSGIKRRERNQLDDSVAASLILDSVLSQFVRMRNCEGRDTSPV